MKSSKATKNGKPSIRIEKLSKFRTQKQNANLHTERGLGMLDEAMAEDGFVAPITAAADGEVIDGSARLEKSLTKFKGEAIVIDHDGSRPIIARRTDIKSAESPEAKRIAFRANRIAQVDLQWSPKVLASLRSDNLLGNSFTQQELASLLPSTVKEDESAVAEMIDKAAELQKKWDTKTGQLWEIDAHRLVCGDSGRVGDVFKLLGDEMVDFVVTSPPYNVGVEYATHDDAWTPWAQYEQFLTRIMDVVVPKLAEGRAVAWNIGTSPKTHHARQLIMFEDRYGLTYYRQMVWKKVGVPVPLWFNTVREPRARRFTPNYQHEVVLLFTKGKLKLGAEVGVDSLCENDVFEFGQQFATTDIPEGTQRTGAQSNLDRRSRKAHPAAFPPRIAAMFTTHFAAEGEHVFDPFLGAGSTMVACADLSRICYGMEISPEYCAVTLERLSALGLTPKLVDE